MKISQSIVLYLHENRGYSYSQIAEMADVTKSHITRVHQGEKGLSDGRLERLEEALGEPLPLILLKSVEYRDISDSLREKYKKLEKKLR